MFKLKNNNRVDYVKNDLKNSKIDGKAQAMIRKAFKGKKAIHDNKWVMLLKII